MTNPRSPIRALRAALFAAVAVTLAGVGHSSMSDHELPLSSLLLAFAVLTAGAWCASGRRRGLLSIGVGMVAVQTVLHGIFAVTGAHSAASANPHAEHLQPPGTSAAPGMAAETTLLDALTHGSAGMLAVHLAAAVLCALWIARGEAAFFQLLETVAAFAFTPLRLLLSFVRLPATPRPAQRRRPRRTRARPRIAVLAHAVIRRGPPSWAHLTHQAPIPAAL
ncbi:hypothetical protein H9Y04_07315 [Streptomyces sp. TRM66268-LWL]|uniref:Integral membrane protein n=1 Tax=Streptomyces polyasparticus TaxID=2767826 RepID=A0ABR7SBI2_9ACTN|nr:hypothetical protein [Streptomyces polyasparticus]MBC9712379.1 hypothetical protein [Streptomyces polyasparticus]